MVGSVGICALFLAAGCLISGGFSKSLIINASGDAEEDIKNTTIARIYQSADVTKAFVNVGITLWSLSANYGTSLTAAAKQCVNTRVNAVRLDADTEIDSMRDFTAQQLSESSDSRQLEEILDTLFGDSSILRKVGERIKESLSNIKEDCEELTKQDR